MTLDAALSHAPSSLPSTSSLLPANTLSLKVHSELQSLSVLAELEMDPLDLRYVWTQKVKTAEAGSGGAGHLTTQEIRVGEHSLNVRTEFLARASFQDRKKELSPKKANELKMQERAQYLLLKGEASKDATVHLCAIIIAPNAGSEKFPALQQTQRGKEPQLAQRAYGIPDFIVTHTLIYVRRSLSDASLASVTQGRSWCKHGRSHAHTGGKVPDCSCEMKCLGSWDVQEYLTPVDSEGTAGTRMAVKDYIVPVWADPNAQNTKGAGYKRTRFDQELALRECEQQQAALLLDEAQLGADDSGSEATVEHELPSPKRTYIHASRRHATANYTFSEVAEAAPRAAVVVDMPVLASPVPCQSPILSPLQSPVPLDDSEEECQQPAFEWPAPFTPLPLDSKPSSLFMPDDLLCIVQQVRHESVSTAASPSSYSSAAEFPHESVDSVPREMGDHFGPQTDFTMSLQDPSLDDFQPMRDVAADQ
jgi:hypothetical protein